jgi:hypothetical protein
MSRLIFSSKNTKLSKHDIDESIKYFNRNEGRAVQMVIPENLRDKAKAIQQEYPDVHVKVGPIRGDRIWLNSQSEGV